MTRINFSDRGETPFQRLLGHSESLMSSWTALAEELSGDGFLSKELKEQVRRVLAQGNGCEYCKAKGKPEIPNSAENELCDGVCRGLFGAEGARVRQAV